MSQKNQFAQIKVLALIFVLFCAFAFPAQTFAKNPTNTLPSLSAFVEAVKDGNAKTLRGIYVSDVMALPIVQQPYGNPGFVSSTPNVATQFSTASEVGNIGLLAHNTLAGALFSNLKQGDRITLVYGDGRLESFSVETKKEYQALEPLSTYSNFKDLQTETVLTANDLFGVVYRGSYHLTLQTCLERDNNSSWGRLFIIAIPVTDKNISAQVKK